MNKQEAIKRIEQMGEYENFVDEAISKKSVLNIISQIDVPKKVVIPNFVIEGEEEEEKLYTVEIPDSNMNSLTVLEKFYDGTIEISQMDVFPVDWRNLTEYHLTEKEIRKDFEWAWQWAKELER